MNESELAWAAGLFDGEGNAGFYAHSHYGNRTTYRLVAQMAQKDREVLDRFQAAMGVGNVTGPDSRNVYKWSITRKEDFEKVYELIGQYVSSIKRLQFETSLEKDKEWRAGRHERHVAAGKIAAAARWGK